MSPPTTPRQKTERERALELTIRVMREHLDETRQTFESAIATMQESVVS